MPTVEYQDDKYFRLMMLSLLIHDFIHDYGAISALNRIKSLEEISQDIFQGNQAGNGKKRQGPTKAGVRQKTSEEKQKVRDEQTKRNRDLDIEIKRERNTLFNLPDSTFYDISEYEYSPEIISFLYENVRGFDADTFSVDTNQPITRSVTADNLTYMRTVLQDENTINLTLTTTEGINALLQSILIVYSYDNIHMIGLIQPIYQYIEQTTFRVTGTQTTNMDDIKKRRILQLQLQTGKGKTHTGGDGDGATLVAGPLTGPNLSYEPYEPQTQTVFEAPNKQVVQNDNIQNVLDAIIDDKVENDNLRDIKSTEIYEALNMVGDENNELNVEYLKFVNKTVHQIIKGTYTFFLQREYTNEYAILNSHYLKQILMKYLLIVLHCPQINPKVDKYDFIIKLSDTFVNNIDTMLNEMCPLPNNQTGFGKKIKKKMLGGAFNEIDLIQIDPNLKTMTVKRNQLIKRLTKLDSTIKQLPPSTNRRYNTILKTNQGIQEQIDAHIFNFNQDVNRHFSKQSESEESGKKNQKISPQMKSVINLLCSEVAFNGLFNLGLSDVNSNVSYPDELDSNGNINYTIFNIQTDIINGISNGDNLSGIDDKLFARIINIPDLWNNNRGTNNYQQLSPTEFINNLNNAHNSNSIINNAIKKSRYSDSNFLQNAVCSTPQYIDAMGGLGSCTMNQINTTNNEFPSTIDIMIQTNTPNYYSTFIKHDKQRVLLEFDYLIDGIKAEPYRETFYLKYGKELLSASNTMNALSTKIMNLWNTRYNQDKSQSSDGVFQDLFKENFNQLISIASRKGKGDRAQEENSVFKNAGYRTATKYNPTNIRIGAMGDRPSGFRAMLDMNFLAPGSVRPNTIAGYFGPSATTAIYSPNLFGGGKKSKKRRKTKRTKGGAKKNTRRATKK